MNLSNVRIVAVALGGIVGVLTSLLTSFFVIRPNLAQSTDNRVSITEMATEPAVTLEQYFSHPSVRSVLNRLKAEYPERTRLLMERDQPRSQTPGTVIDFGIEVAGLRGVPLGGRWSLFDADTGRRLGESENLDPLPLSFSIEKKDSDTGSWEAWVDTSSFSAEHFFVRIELFDERQDARLTFKDSPIFTKPLYH
jgi:hypothetical protein